jgi:hypothetical protein
LQFLFSKNLAPIAGELARHFEAAAEFSLAIRYLRLAADAASARSASQEAATHMGKAIALLERIKCDATPPFTNILEQRI